MVSSHHHHKSFGVTARVTDTRNGRDGNSGDRYRLGRDSCRHGCAPEIFECTGLDDRPRLVRLRWKDFKRAVREVKRQARP
jgi:hypothetical protein